MQCFLAAVGDEADYTPLATLITFQPSASLSQRVEIPITIFGDANAENVETFFCVLSSPQPDLPSIVLQPRVINITISGECVQCLQLA